MNVIGYDRWDCAWLWSSFGLGDYYIKCVVGAWRLLSLVFNYAGSGDCLTSAMIVRAWRLLIPIYCWWWPHLDLKTTRSGVWYEFRDYLILWFGDNLAGFVWRLLDQILWLRLRMMIIYMLCSSDMWFRQVYDQLFTLFGNKF